jgi:hypothetical protein
MRPEKGELSCDEIFLSHFFCVFTFVVLVQLVCFEQQRKVNAIEVIVPLC